MESKNKSRLILIAEDSPTQAEQIKYIFEKLHYRVIVSVNGAEALAQIKDYPPDLLISDIVMPEINGYELCKIIKADEKTRDIPVILLTSLTLTDSVFHGIDCGADGFVNKPFNEEFLISHVENLIKARTLNKDNHYEISLQMVVSGEVRFVTVNPVRMISLLMSTYESAVKKNEELIQTQKELQNLNNRLEELVSERTAELTEENIIRKEAEEKVRIANSELEERVLLRTAQLEESNKELESFSYSVSHDLRAPLRAINGFVTALHSDYQEGMDAEFTRLTGLINANTVKMGTLIEALLNISKLGRKELVKTPINFNTLVDQVVKDLELNKNEKLKAKIKVGKLKLMEGDHTLLYQVFFNLISNAIKYSSKKPSPEIEINALEKENEIVFSVKDNGVGFNMKYAHKLFVVFQRLHETKDFEGTGVGLAIVKRIISKHGGNVWAEGVENEGATFYFSLPLNP